MESLDDSIRICRMTSIRNCCACSKAHLRLTRPMWKIPLSNFMAFWVFASSICPSFTHIQSVDILEPVHKNRLIMVSGLWFFKCTCAVTYLGYRHAFCLKLSKGPYYISLNSKGSGTTGLLYRLAWALAGRIRDKYHFLVCLLNNWLLVSLKLIFMEIWFL